MKLQKSIAAILAVFIFTLTASAQFGGLLKKAQDKVDKATKKVETTTNVNTNVGGNSGAQNNGGNEGARWDLFKCNPEYVGAVNENKLREMVEYNVNGDWGKGGLIVFTKQPLTKKNPTIADTVWTFKAGEPIYMNIVLPAALELDDAIGLSTDGNAITTVGDYQKQCQAGYFKNSLYVNYGRFDKSLPQVFALDFQPKGGTSAKYQQQIKGIAEVLLNLKPGVHLVPIRISGNGTDGATSLGAFYYDNRDGKGGMEAIEAGRKAITMPAANPKFAAVERQIMALAKSYVRVVITDRDWTPVRNELTGVLIGRAITAVTAMKLDDGTCRRETQSWLQDYNGSTYTGLRLDGFRDQLDMACENALK